MAGLWQVIIPQSSTVPNLDCNPSFEISACPGNTTGSAGCTAGAGTLAMDQTYQHWGLQAAKYTPSAAAYDGFFKTYVLTSGSTYYFSCDFSGSLGVPYVAYFATTGSALVGTAGSVAGTGAWVANRPVATYTAGSTGAYRVYVAKNNSADTQPFWVDGCLLTTSGSNMAYVDGDQTNCYWSGYQQGSVSYGNALSFNVGQLANLTDDLGISVNGWAGTGMPTESNIYIEYGLVDGAMYQRTKHMARAVDFTLTFPGVSLQDLHARRNRLEKIMRYDATLQPAPRLFRYLGGAQPVNISAVYESGLEGSYQNGPGVSSTTGFVETGAMRVIAPDPYFYSDGNDAASLATSGSLSATNWIVNQNPNGLWSNLGTGLAGSVGITPYVNAMAFGVDGALYVGGQFQYAGGINTGQVAKWANGAWVNIGSLLGGLSTVNSLLVDPNGALYVGGSFSSIGGVSGSSLAKLSGSSWSSPFGAGLYYPTGQAAVSALAMGPDGSLYAGGYISRAGATVQSGSALAKWDGVNWIMLGVTKQNTAVLTLAWGLDGALYAGGSFTTLANGTSACGIARFDGTNFSNLSTGLNGTVYDIVFTSDGTLFACGNFSTAGGQAANNIAKWNGASWTPLGSGLNGTANSMWIDPNGLLYVGGAFTIAGGVPIAGAVAVWNGSSWANLSAQVPGNICYAIMGNRSQGLYIGSGSAGTTYTGAVTPVNNQGSATEQPVITVTGPGTLYQIKNYSTGDVIYFNLTMATGEVVTLNLTPGNTSLNSSYRGNILGTVLPGSNLTTFRMVPGINNILVFVGGATAATSCNWQWKRRHTTIDGPN